jgi:hypothetical protein
MSPDGARRAAQELIVQEHVDALAGIRFTPNAIRRRCRLNRSQEAALHHKRCDVEHHGQESVQGALRLDDGAVRERIDPKTRYIVQNVYVRRVERIAGRLQYIEIGTISMVHDSLER